MVRILRLIFPLFLLFLGVVSSEIHAAPAPGINVLQVKGTINPVLTDYIKRGITDSERNNAIACIIQMDTPGGLDTAMRDIVQSILNARVPVIVYVSPSGARAASAGVFITLSAHIAAMAPNTAIGAAHPVSIGDEDVSPDMAEKVVNDAAAYIRGIATNRGRNADWAEKAVRESVSITAEEAVKQNVVDMTASTLQDLITQINGKQVTLFDGSQITINTSNSSVKQFGMTPIEDLLFTVSDPNIAYILLSIGALGIMAEIFHPGMIFPGVLGAVSLLLALFSLGMMPVNWTGVILIILAIGLFIAEVLTPGFGIFTAAGAVSFIIGSLILFKGGSPLFYIDPWLIAVVTIIIVAFVAFIVFRVVVTYRKKATTGREDLIGSTAIVKETLDPNGTVFLEGELWSAISKAGRIESGEEVTVNKIDGLKLFVIRK